MEQRRSISIRKWILPGFFFFMAACTIVSRIYDSVTVPKVLTTSAKRKAVETVIEGTGTVEEKEKIYYPVFTGLRIDQTVVRSGSEVEKGDLLFCYDMETVMEKKEEIQLELEQIELNIQKEQISAENVQGLTQEETARWELELAQRELEEGQIAFEEVLARHEEELERLKNHYEDNLKLAKEELWQQQEKEWESARQALDSAKNSRNDTLRAARREIEDMEEELELISEEEEETYERLEKKIKRAREDLSALEQSLEEAVDFARFQLDLVNAQEDRLRSEKVSVLEAEKESYEAAVEQQEEKLKDAQKKVEELQKLVEQAQWKVYAAEKQDTAVRKSEEQKNRISQLTVRGLELDKKGWGRKLERLEELIEKEGLVLSMENGVVIDWEIAEGRTASGEELVSLATGSSRFEGTFLKEEQKLTKGDKIEITIPGTSKKKEAVIDSINLLGETEGIFQADLGDLELTLGAVTSYSCKKQSEIFNQVIPVEALRKDMKGYYCLVARSRSTILGEEFRAERVEVQILYQGSQEVAVEGSLFEEDAIIRGENQSIDEGDRVRPVSGF